MTTFNEKSNKTSHPSNVAHTPPPATCSQQSHVPAQRTPGSTTSSKSAGSIRSRNQGHRQQQESNPSSTNPTRTLYLIRHGESLGQRASRQRRKTDEGLTDCGLTRNGIEQAKFVPELLSMEGVDPNKIQFVVTSPLTRAIHTTLLAFPTRSSRIPPSNGLVRHRDDLKPVSKTLSFESGRKKGNDPMEIDNDDIDEDMTDQCSIVTENERGPFTNIPILMAYDLREVGSLIPENKPRKLKDIWRDLQVDDVTLKRFDLESLLYPNSDSTVSPKSSSSSPRASERSPISWPRGHDTPPKVIRKDRIRQVFAWLAAYLPVDTTTLAVICHYHVIRTSLSDPGIDNCPVHPQNAQPLECVLHSDGSVELIRVLGEI